LNKSAAGRRGTEEKEIRRGKKKSVSATGHFLGICGAASEYQGAGQGGIRRKRDGRPEPPAYHSETTSRKSKGFQWNDLCSSQKKSVSPIALCRRGSRRIEIALAEARHTRAHGGEDSR